MTVEQKTDFVKYWIPVVVFFCFIVTYIVTSATRFNAVEFNTVENTKDIAEIKTEMKANNRIVNEKLDILISKQR